MEKTNHLIRMTVGFGTLRIFLVSDVLSSVPLLLWSILFGVSMSLKHNNNKKTGPSRESPGWNKGSEALCEEDRVVPLVQERSVPSSPLLKCCACPKGRVFF